MGVFLEGLFLILTFSAAWWLEFDIFDLGLLLVFEFIVLGVCILFFRWTWFSVGLCVIMLVMLGWQDEKNFFFVTRWFNIRDVTSTKTYMFAIVVIVENIFMCIVILAYWYLAQICLLYRNDCKCETYLVDLSSSMLRSIKSAKLADYMRNPLICFRFSGLPLKIA